MRGMMYESCHKAFAAVVKYGECVGYMSESIWVWNVSLVLRRLVGRGRRVFLETIEAP